jgi:phage repressor protein C with HTH and peptisase S24 domain
LNSEEPTGPMTLAERIRWCARVKMKSGNELAKESALPRRTLESYMAGKAEPKVSALVAIAKAAGVSIAWLATGEAPVHAPERIFEFIEQTGGRQLAGVPVVGLAECGLKGWYQRDPLTVSASRPGDFFDPDGFAVIAVGQSMVPAGIFEGFLCFCSPGTSPSKGDAIYIERADGAAALKVFSGWEGEWLSLLGWLDEKDGRREPYTDRLLRSAVRRIATVIYIKRKL